MDPTGDSLIRLSIGLTAHRDLVLHEEPALRAAVRAFLEGLRRDFPQLPLRLVTALAEGGDQLAAQEAVALGVELLVPLPMEQAEYERDFQDPQALARFRQLIAKADVRVLPMMRGSSLDDIVRRGEDRNRQYAQQGMFVSSHCQVLLALWDGNPSTATGGTAQAVEFHLHNVMSSLSVDQVAPNLLADDESDLIYHIGCSRRVGSKGMPPRIVPLACRWLTVAGASDAGAGMPAHYRHVFGQMEQFNLDMQRYSARILTEPSPLFKGELPGEPPASARVIERQFSAADWLALHFQHRVRGSLLCTHVIAALMGIAFIAFSDSRSGRWYAGAFLTLFVLGLLLAMMARRRQWQRKYLDYRGLAEGLRVQFYWRMAGVEIPANSSLGYDSFLQKQDVDLSWIRHAMRGVGLMQDSQFESGPGWLDWVIRHWVGDAVGNGGQLEYFRTGSRQRARAFWLTSRIGDLALLGGLLGATALVLGGARLSSPVQQSLVLAMGLLPLLSGIREAYSYKKADKELIKQFRFMCRLFESCRERLARSRSHAETRKLLLALGGACLEEHAEWILLHRERPLENAPVA